MKMRLVEAIAALSVAAAVVLPFIRKAAIRNHLPEILAGISLFIAILLVFHQYFTHGFWFRGLDFWNHECGETFFLAAAVGLLFGKYLGRCRVSD